MEYRHQFKRGFFIGLLAGAVGSALLYKKKGNLSKIWWKLRLRADIYRQIKELKRLSRGAYEEIVDSVLAKYGEAGIAASSQLQELEDLLKSEWRAVKRQFAEVKEEIEGEEE